MNDAVKNFDAIKKICDVPNVKKVDLDWVAKLSDEERGCGRVGYVVYFEKDDGVLFKELKKKINEYLKTVNLEIHGSLYGVDNREAHKASIEEFKKEFPEPKNPQANYYDWMRRPYYDRKKGSGFKELQKYQNEIVGWRVEYQKAVADGRIVPDKLPGFEFSLGTNGENAEISSFYNSLNYKGD